MKNLKHPAFIFAIIGAILLFVGIGYKSTGNATGNYLMYTGVAIGGIFWIRSIFRVVNSPDLKPFQRNFWLISVIAVPVVGGLVFHVLHQAKGKITT